jgi:hypothetical protein
MRVSWALLVLVFASCIGTGIRVSGHGIPSRKNPVKVTVGGSLGPVSVAVAVDQIRAGLSRVRDTISQRRSQLPTVRCGSASCYSAEQVRSALETIRRDVQSAFPDVALASRLTLDEELADAVEELGRKPRASAMVHLIRSPSAAPPSTYPVGSVHAVFDRIRERIDAYLAHEQLNPTIHIKSDPVGATFEMKIGDNERTRREALTDGEVQSVWRGRYGGEVRKKGYRDVRGFQLDLINDRRTTVRCTLVRDNAPQVDESRCRLED